MSTPADQKKLTKSKPDLYKDARGRYRATDARVMAIDNGKFRPKLVPARIISSTPVRQSYQKKTRAMVAKFHEVGEEGFMSVNMERPRSSVNSKKSSSNRLTSK